MASDTFRFKQFTVKQTRSAMKVGTDGVLLGSWVSLRRSERRILDIGTGTGLIALMLAQKSSAEIDAVEIEPEAAAEAKENIGNSPWRERITIYQSSFQDFAQEKILHGTKYDLIVSNPPYFIHSVDYLRSGPKSRVAARHAAMLPYDDIIEWTLPLLAPQGRFSAIFPYQEAGVFIAKAADKRLYCNRVLYVHPKPGRPVKRVVAEFSLEKSKQPQQETLIIVNDEGNYNFTDEYRRLTKDFYLHF